MIFDKNISDEDLNQCYEELLDFRTSGTLKDGKVRTIAEERVLEKGQDFLLSLMVLENELLFEMATRYHRITKAN